MRHLGLTLPALSHRGFETHLLAFGSRISPFFLSEMSGIALEYHPIRRNPACVVLDAIPLIRGMVERIHPDIVFLHSFVAGVAGRLALSGAESPRVVYVPHAFSWHRPQPLWRRWLVHGIERALAGRCDGFMCVGPGDVQDAVELGVPDEKIFLCPNGLPDGVPFLERAEARRQLEIPQDGVFGVFAARMERQKGLMTLLRAVRKSMEGDYGIKCFGEGALKNRARRFIVKHELNEKVSFFHEVEHLWSCFRAFDFLVMPSYYEGSSYAVLEAEAAGIPVIMADIPSAPDNAVLFPVGDSEALADILRRWPQNACRSRKEWRLPCLDEQIERIIEMSRRLTVK